MSNWPLVGAVSASSIFNAQVDLAASTGFLSLDKTSGGDGDTWVEYDPSWAETTNRLRIWNRDFASARYGSWQIGVGSIGNERILIKFPGVCYSERDYLYLTLPITIHKGERVSILVQTTSTATALINLAGWYDPLVRTDLRYYDLMGHVSVNSLVNPDPGDTLHTKGAYSEITASTAHAYKSIVILFGALGSTSENTTVHHIFDLAIGASESEVIILPDFDAVRDGRRMGKIPGTNYIAVDMHIPAGVRLAARCQADSVDAGLRARAGIAIIGLY